MLEPTDNALHARLPREPERRARLPRRERPLRAALDGRERDRARRRGARAHPPRPAARGGAAAASRSSRSATATRLEGGIAANVVPDRATCLLNLPLRAGPLAPQRRRRASATLAERAGADEVAITGNSAAAPVVVGRAARPAAARRRRPGRAPKQAWTPVAEFAEVGVDAVNFGPGATALRAPADEQVEIAALVRIFETSCAPS